MRVHSCCRPGSHGAAPGCTSINPRSRREVDLPAVGEQTLNFVDYSHPYWYNRLVVDPADGTIRRTSERAVTVREALVAALGIRGRDADRVEVLVG